MPHWKQSTGWNMVRRRLMLRFGQSQKRRKESGKAMAAIFPMAGISAISMVGAGMSFWEGFYFACFVAGLLLSVVSLIGGMGHISWHFHPPHVPHVPQGVAHHSAGSVARGPATIPWWNAFSIMVFLCWFGAAGYLMTRYGSFVASVVFALAAICGLAGGAV